MITDLVFDVGCLESSWLSEVVWLDAPHVMRGLVGEVVHQSAEGDLELGAGRCRSSSRGPTRIP